MNEHEELNRILSAGCPKVCEELEEGDDFEVLPAKVKYNQTSSPTQWTSDNGRLFIPSAESYKALPPGMYTILNVQGIGWCFEKINIKTEGLLRFPQANSDTIVEEIEKFWERDDRFKKFKLNHKRGILMWGPAGSGKSSTIQLIIRDVIKRGGIAINFVTPSYFIAGMRLLRSIQPTTPVVVLMEDIDEILKKHPESDVLNVLDGVESIEHVCFLATTNYPEELGARIINRPSRFDKRFKIAHPNEESRLMYFDYLFRNHKDIKDGYDLKQWVIDTDGLSLAHLKELFVAVVILEDQYASAIQTLQSMREQIESDKEGTGTMGFAKPKKKDLGWLDSCTGS